MSDKLETISLYPPLMYEEDKTPDCGIEIDELCEQVKAATDGWGSDKKGLIDTFGSMTPEDRLKVSIRYKDLYDVELKTLVKKETSGDFGMALKFCSFDPIVSECAMLKEGCKGIGSQKAILYSILCGRSNQDIELLKKTYYKTYTKDLTSLIMSEVGGDLKKLISSCMQAAEEEFDPDYHTQEKAEEDAEELYEAGQGRWGTNENKMFKVIVLSPPAYLKMVNETYADKYGYTLAKAMEKELSGDAQKAAIYTVNMKLKPYEAIAKVIKSACAGIGTDELLLTCCVIRYQHIMGQVNMAHMELFGKSIHDRIRHECGGSYKDLLLALVNKVFPEE